MQQKFIHIKLLHSTDKDDMKYVEFLYEYPEDLKSFWANRHKNFNMMFKKNYHFTHTVLTLSK